MVHAVRQGSVVLKKGTRITATEVEALEGAGVREIVVVRLEEGDVSEDVAAASVAQAITGDGLHVDHAFTGRANIFARRAGVFMVDREAVDGVNGLDEAITLATLSAYKPVVEGEMVATVKIIPFGVTGDLCARAVAAGQKILHVAPYTVSRVGVISSMLPGLTLKTVDKTIRVTSGRLAPAGARIVAERRVLHEEKAVARAILDLLEQGVELVIVFGASAIADRRDVIPAAITASGGSITHFGLPVDPGNLLLIGSLPGPSGPVAVVGAPGCARSPAENAFDWVLMRLLAGFEVTRAQLVGMGVGGLLSEIVSRPQPRAEAQAEGGRRIAAIVLAAGRSTRMAGPNKLLAELNGRPLVRMVTEQALASRVSEVIVVTGHQVELVEQTLEGLEVQFVYNRDFSAGLATSIRMAITAVTEPCDGVVICLGDMPLIDADLINRLIASFAPDRGNLIVVPVNEGRRGNPVLWSRRFFAELMTLDGDVGARHLIAKYAEVVTEVPVDAVRAFVDVDTSQALEEVRRG